LSGNRTEWLNRFAFLGRATFGTLALGFRQGQEGLAMTPLPKAIIAVSYEEYARQYQRQLRLENYMESDDQATQRAITLACLALVEAVRKDFHVFNEMLIQYPLGGRKKRPGQVVPDNMVVVSEEPLTAQTSFNTPLEPAGPYWVMEYVSKSSKRKDYEENLKKYEQELKVPYYLTFYPQTQDLTLYQHTGEKYVSVKPNEHGRYALPEVEIEVALLDGWVRYWYQGKLLLLPAELQRGLDDATRRADQEKTRADDLQAEVTRLRALLGKRSDKDEP